MAPYSRNSVGPPGGARFHNKSILGALKAMELIDSKPALPAEILATILDYLPVSDLMHVAQTSRRLREMVYDDTRWVVRLQSMGCWSEAEARRRFEEAVAKRRRDTAAAQAAVTGGGPGAAGAAGRPMGGGSGVRPGAVPGVAGGRKASSTLFDASLEEERRRQFQQMQLQQQQLLQQQQQQLSQMRDGFEAAAIGGSGSSSQPPTAVHEMQDPEVLLDVFKHNRSMRGYARQEYARIYGALAPFYWDLVRARSHADPAVFKVFRDPERQARMLANLRRFSQSDWSQGWRQRQERLAAMTAIFESAVLREFEQGYEFWDVDGRMHQYAHVLDMLNGSTAGVDLFIQKHPIFADREVAASSSMDCIRQAPAAAANPWGAPPPSAAAAALAGDDVVTLEPSRAFFERLAAKVNEQGEVIGRIFPQPAHVFWIFVDKVREDIIMEYITPLLDETHERSMAAYLKAVSGLFEQCMQFLHALKPPSDPNAVAPKTAAPAAADAANGKDGSAQGSKSARRRSARRPGSRGTIGKSIDFAEDAAAGDEDPDGLTQLGRMRKAREMAYKAFEPHLDLYLQEELDFFTKHAEAQVADWDKKLTEQDASVESFYMANFNRQEVKKDFLSSFRKVVMMPVTVLPSLPGLGSSSSSSSKQTAANDGNDSNDSKNGNNGNNGNRSSLSLPPAPGGLPSKAPDDELAAKAALMASRLEGIKSLFSIEVALNLVHAAKSSLGRAAVFVQLDGQAAGEAREQCENIFVVLLRVLGNGHVKQGFDRAVDHLSHYNPRTGSAAAAAAVAAAGATSSSSGSSSSSSITATDASAAATTAASSTGTDATTVPASDGGVAPLMTFIELVNVGDLISQMIDVFYEQQLAGPKIADRNDFLDPAGIAKKRFEQMIDESVAAGLNKGIDVLMDEVEYICATMHKPTDYYPESADVVPESGLSFLNGTLGSVTGSSGTSQSGDGGTSTPKSGSGGGASGGGSAFDIVSGGSAGGAGLLDIGPTRTAVRVVELVRGHTNMLKGSTEKTMLDVFNGEVGLRLFTAVCKHLKRQRISMQGAVHVIADMTLYFDYIRTLRNPDLLEYFRALRELSQLYLIDARHHAKEMAVIIADGDRFGGIFRAEEVYEFAERRADWYQVKRDVERAMYGLECRVM